MTPLPAPINCDISSYSVEMIVPVALQIWANDAEEARTMALSLLQVSLETTGAPICIGFPRVVVKELK